MARARVPTLHLRHLRRPPAQDGGGSISRPLQDQEFVQDSRTGDGVDHEPVPGAAAAPRGGWDDATERMGHPEASLPSEGRQDPTGFVVREELLRFGKLLYLLLRAVGYRLGNVDRRENRRPLPVRLRRRELSVG